jgi:hypothetical protein
MNRRLDGLSKKVLIRASFLLLVYSLAMVGSAQATQARKSNLEAIVLLNGSTLGKAFPLFENGHIPPLYVSPEDSETVHVVADAFLNDCSRVSGEQTRIISSTKLPRHDYVIIVGTLGHSALLDQLQTSGALDVRSINGKWESAVVAVLDRPAPGIRKALVIAGSDRRGTAFALFSLSQQMGVSPWNWWADVPVKRQKSVTVAPGIHVQEAPSVQYRGIFFNDEDWGLRPWAARKMDTSLQNIGPRTYERIFELVLRLRGNTVWPAMHPGTLAFNAVAENAQLADRWGIIMSSSHSEALLRNNVGEWDRKTEGPWNYQTNSTMMDKYWDDRLIQNGKYENFYTVGLRGEHDSGLEAAGSTEVKARLVEKAMTDQRDLLAKRVSAKLAEVPQVIWLYKESIDLYRAGMRVPDDVTLGWTDDNYGYIRQLPNEEEQKRSGGSGLYYHVSYWGRPHDYLWLCSTPPALMHEELTKAWDHGVRKLWILNVGDLKPAEADIDYFMRLAWNEPDTAGQSQQAFLESWAAEQFPDAFSKPIADMLRRYYQLNMVRRPEFMGFNGYDDNIKRTDFNPNAWGDQNHQRLQAWQLLAQEAESTSRAMPAAFHDAYFELVMYPIAAAAAQNTKFLWMDRSYLDAKNGKSSAVAVDALNARAAYDGIQRLTATYNSLGGGKWEGMMSSAPRERHSFDPPVTANSANASPQLPAAWRAAVNHAPSEAQPPSVSTRFKEKSDTVSMNAAHFTRKHNAIGGTWHILQDLGISGDSVVFGSPGRQTAAAWINGANSASTQPFSRSSQEPWLEYDFTVITEGKATLTVHLLPTFPIDSSHGLCYGVALDGGAIRFLDASGSGEGRKDLSSWSANVLRNSAEQTLGLGQLEPGKHTLRMVYGEPGVIFEHFVVTFSQAPPAYPVPPEQ